MLEGKAKRGEARQGDSERKPRRRGGAKFVIILPDVVAVVREPIAFEQLCHSSVSILLFNLIPMHRRLPLRVASPSIPRFARLLLFFAPTVRHSLLLVRD